jgi:hypothetical protein
VSAALAKAFCRERRLSRHENLTDSDVRLGWFRHAGFAALLPKLACRVWSRISLPNSFPFTGSSTPVPSGNGGEENCISVSATAHRCPKLPQSEALGTAYFFEHFMSDSLPTLQSSIAVACLSAALHHGGFGSGLLH